jgi:hypothetical protein
MGGFPTRASRAALGPTYQNEKEVTDPQREIGALVANLNFWQVAGLSQVTPRIVIKASVSGGVITNNFQAMAFDPDSGVSAISFVYEKVGHYSFAFASQYPDELGVNQNLSLIAGIAMPVNGMPTSGSHTGANNQPTLLDGTKTWGADDYLGMQVYNVTDGSSGLITTNTVNTIVAALAGGTDNDWDTGDTYIVLPAGIVGHVDLTSAYEGDIYFVSPSVRLAEASEFILLLW